MLLDDMVPDQKTLVYILHASKGPRSLDSRTTVMVAGSIFMVVAAEIVSTRQKGTIHALQLLELSHGRDSFYIIVRIWWPFLCTFHVGAHIMLGGYNFEC